MSAPGNPKATSDRWRRVEALYNEMRARPPDERASALAAACPGEPALMAEVQSLLDQPGSAEEFLNSPALEVAARLASGAPSTLTGRRIGVFEVQGLLGVGGMGEVYRARDTRLGRSVAIKILPRAFKDDPERMVRFEREARVLASLSHPRICALYDVGRDQDTDYLVMELVEGETLSSRLKKGPLPLDHTLRVAIEIAEALDKAHRQGVIHRDLKPGNVMLTKSGSKLMDFGLAKLTLAGKDAEGISALPTASEPLTGEGTLMGTVPYMAPEQLEGKTPDARSDLWALGCLLYEMATGRPAFAGKTQASLISAILTTVPQPISQLQPLTPLALERLVKVCLAKDPDDRLQTAHDVMQELKWIEEAGTSGVVGSGLGRSSPGRGRWKSVLVGLALMGSLALGATLGARLLAPRSPPPDAVRAILSVAPAEEVNSGDRFGAEGGSRTALTWTPDGRALIFVGRQAGTQRIYVRDLVSEQARPVEGTEGAESVTVSPDGQWIAFFAAGFFKKVPIAGGPPATIIGAAGSPLDALYVHSLAWGGDGRLFYGQADCGTEKNVICVAAPERGAIPATKRSPGAGEFERHVLPHVLPGDAALLYTIRRRSFTWGDEEVAARVFATGETRVLLKDAADARYVGSGHLVFMRRGTLFGVGFDLSHVEVVGSPVPLLGAVSQAIRAALNSRMTGAGHFSVSSTGALAWLRGTIAPRPAANIVRVDRQGRLHPLTVEPLGSGSLSVSPNGRQIAVTKPILEDGSLWIYDLDRGTQAKLQGGEIWWPRWTPDGQRIAFRSIVGGVSRIVWRRADGTGLVETLIENGGHPSSWSPDGRELAYSTNSPNNGDIWVATLGSGTVTARAVIETADWEGGAEFSPDGKWLMYTSDTSGRDEVYVQPYPGPGPRQQVSLEGGHTPAWNPAGGEIFFARGDFLSTQDMMSVRVRFGPQLNLGKPRLLFANTPWTRGCQPSRCYGVSPDGQFFYASLPAAPQPPRPPVTQIHLITNWVEELKAKVAAGQAK